MGKAGLIIMMRKMIDVIAVLLLGHCDFGKMAPHSHHTQHAGVWSFVVWQSTEHIFCCKCLGSASKREGVRKRLKTSERWFDPALKYPSQYSGTNLTLSHPPWQIVGSANTLPLPISISLCKKESNRQFWSKMPIQKMKRGRESKNIVFNIFKGTFIRHS